MATFSLSVVDEESLDENAAEAGDEEGGGGEEGEGEEGGDHLDPALLLIPDPALLHLSGIFFIYCPKK